SYEAMVNNTTKPIIQEVKNASQAEAIMKMAFAVAGSNEAFRMDPFTALLVENEEALSIKAAAADVVIAGAKQGVPVIFSSKLITGLTAPQASAGAIVCALANALAAITLSQMTAAGSPIVLGGFFSMNDTDNDTCPYGAPEVALLGAGLSAVLGSLNIPCFGFAGATDAKISDAQMGLESTFSLLHAGLAGTNLIYGAGQMETGEYGSAFLLVMASEVMGMTRRIIQGVTMDEDRLARGVIDAVQPGGHYLGSPHTRYYFKKEQFWPKLMNRARIDDWTAAGARSLGQRTMEMTRSLLAMATPEPLPSETQEKIQAIVAKADAKL
ncbi:MAG: trimethylamine methyltransferase family protein, partial [Bacillota bacterium]|nr:trimethylamine methyltransferase family protein [Bacillota bacterium]